MKRPALNSRDWRKMRGMARGGKSLTKALIEERDAEKAHDDARVADATRPGRRERSAR